MTGCNQKKICPHLFGCSASPELFIFQGWQLTRHVVGKVLKVLLNTLHSAKFCGTWNWCQVGILAK